MADKNSNLFERLMAFAAQVQGLIIVFIVLAVAAAIVIGLVALLWVVAVGLVVGLYKLFIAFRKWVKSGKPAVIADKIGGKTSAALGLTNPFIRTPVVWACRIIGPIACLGGIAFAIDAINGETAKPDDPGLGGGIATFLLSCVMTAYGYWPRKKQPS